jgi:hypothetical protein
VGYPLVAFSTVKRRIQKMNPATHGTEGSASAPVLYMALELSNKTWRLALSDGTKRRQVTVPAADLTGERGGWSVVRVPSPEEEDARHLHRELERLKREWRAASGPHAVVAGHAGRTAHHQERASLARGVDVRQRAS